MPRRGRELAEEAARLRSRGWTYKQIAARWQEQHGFNPRVAFRHACGLTQQQVADRWNERWPSDNDSPKTGKHLAYWEAWPGETGRAPSLETLNRLAFIYQCSTADLLESEDYSYLDTASGGIDESQAAAVEPADNSAGGELIVKPPDMPLAAAGQTGAETASPVIALTNALASGELDYDTLVHLLRVMAYYMKRRDFLHRISRAAGVAAATPLVGALNPDERDRMVGIIHDPSRVDASAIDNVRTILWACRRQDGSLGPQAVLDTVLAQTRFTEIMLAGEPPEALQSRLLSLYAELRGFTGDLLFDLCEYESAGVAYEHARTLTHEAGNTALAANVLSNLSRLATWQGRPREGIDYALAAQGWAVQTESPRTRAYAASVAARAYASDGQHALALKVLEQECDAVDGGWADADRHASWLYNNARAAYLTNASVCALARKDSGIAADKADEALAENKPFVQQNAFTILLRAEARIQQGEIEAACVDMAHAADLLARNTAERAQSQLRMLRSSIGPNVKTAALAELDERLRGWRV
jgi:hypothetical protein